MAQTAKPALLAILLLVLIFGERLAVAQPAHGELRLEVRDPQGAALPSHAELVNDASQFHAVFSLGSSGTYAVRGLPFGTYKLDLSAKGFASWSGLVRIHSEVPVRISVSLALALVSTQVEVSDSATLMDSRSTGSIYSIGQSAITQHIPTQPGRDLTDLVNAEPGWLYEANGVLHPRGSEYDVQYVVNGLPLTQNRSPAFAPAFAAGEVQSMLILTANYPAEYGRKLGGVIEVNTKENMPSGLHGQLDLSGGSFSAANASGNISYAEGKNRFVLNADAFHTGRYLDPPVLANFTNTANSGGFEAAFERNLSEWNRLRLSVAHRTVNFLAPNELVQQQAGQQQNISNQETAGQIDFQHAVSTHLLFTFAGSVRNAGSILSSNAFSTPVIVSQDRGYTEGYARADMAAHSDHQEWKFGVDSLFTSVHENLRYLITDPAQFDPTTQQSFQFADKKDDFEPSIYVQDQLHFGNWNVSAGARFDHYDFLVRQSALSPRLGVSRYFPALNLLVHASYDRIFQTPAVENLLLASSPLLDSINPIVVRLPLLPAHANYYEFGFTKTIFGKLRLDSNVFRRDFRNYSDDDVLLDTGISFPIAFAQATIKGEEVSLQLPVWGRFSGALSYSNQIGTGQGPITGGLFLGSDASGLSNTSRFPVTQDQRNTLHFSTHFQLSKRIWLAGGAQYGSGLPAEIDGEDRTFLLAQFGPEILSRVNFDRERVRPNFSIDVGAGAELFHKEHRSAELQLQSSNITNRVNVINFASLFSGTAVAASRSISARLKITF